ncbi:MAG TPA: O-antigen ligase family protein [Thermomonas sp.]|jgi:O-antigen ligase|uniref:O-antigen ligase family protein n=1 Tax=Thermomonas sp. TaxID=1971895 RepID=UPI002B8B0B55|nr:O-antigen ligase family protein [Thermomonas sp.]HPM55863.1 O-antigen ligase family protein [Thermomonas sp.]HPW12386.1 O-antigen ligase family protein [Thermomonas sp.]
MNDATQAVHGWRWAPAWVLAFVALWPAPGYAEGVLALGALAGLLRLVASRFRGGNALLSGPAWALTSVLFFAYWLPEAVSAIDAMDRGRALREALVDLRYLPFLWIVAAAVADDAGRRRTFGGLAIIVGAWTLDALIEAATGASPLFSGIDMVKHAISGHGMCTAEQVAAADRLAGVLGPCNLKLGIVLASLSPFALDAMRRRFGRIGWLVAAVGIGIVVLLAGSRASWLTYGLVLLWTGWRTLGRRKLLMVFALGALALVAATLVVPQVRERIERTTHVLTADSKGVDTALSGRSRIWSAAVCMAREHPVNGVGARGFRQAFAACDPQPGVIAAWGEGAALHAHQLVLEILSETGGIGLLLWLAGAALAWRAWRYADPVARDRARPAMLALAVTVFPLNTHLASYSTFWGGVLLMLSALYAGSLLGREQD